MENRTEITVTLGSLPEIGYGTYIGIENKPISNRQKRHDATVAAILTALRNGYRHLDLAQNYNNLPAVREALSIAFKPKSEGGLGLQRHNVWITMKANRCDKASINSLLDQTGVTYFDLFLIHHPQSVFHNRETLEEAWRMLSSLNSQLIHIGVSNFYEPHLNALIEICESEGLPLPYANQIQLSVFVDEARSIECCAEKGIRVIAYSPLGYQWAEILVQHETLCAIAEEIHATPAQVALAWLLTKGVAVIPQSTQEARMIENLQAADVKYKLTEKHMRQLNQIHAGFGDSALNHTALDSKAHGDSLAWTQSHSL